MDRTLLGPMHNLKNKNFESIIATLVNKTSRKRYHNRLRSSLETVCDCVFSEILTLTDVLNSPGLQS